MAGKQTAFESGIGDGFATITTFGCSCFLSFKGLPPFLPEKHLPDVAQGW
jgi:hypothetical protein